jgi:AcrR family transcriptional regulator
LADHDVKDARVRRTRRRLHAAIVSLIHEKTYPAIAVHEILDRADVGRSAFYAHFANKDALLANRIEKMLHATAPRPLPPSVGRLDKALWFSFPVFEYIGRHRQATDAKMGRRGRAIVHQHLRRVLVERIRDDVRMAQGCSDGRNSTMPTDLISEYIVATFILVLNWWVDSRSLLSPREVDDVFLALVVPSIASAIDQAERASAT